MCCTFKKLQFIIFRMFKGTPRDISEKRFSAVINVPLERSSSSVVCELPGWSLSDYTRTGKLGLWNISRLLETNRTFGNYYDVKMPVSKTPDGATLYAVAGAQKTILARELNQLAAISCPMIFSIRTGYIGKTSFSFLVELRHKDTGTLLARIERQAIVVDSVTRKANAVPPRLEKIKDKYPPTGFKVKVSTKPSNPANYYEASIKIQASDLDQLYHVNQSMYYRYTMDSAQEAIKAGFLPNFKHDICEYDVREFHGKHISEAFAGDNISVCVWEDMDDKLSLHFEIRNIKNDSLVMYQTIKFFPLIDSRL